MPAMWASSAGASSLDSVEPIGSPLRLTHHGPDGAPHFDAYTPRVAWDGRRNQFLMVWSAIDDRAPGEFEIYAMRLDANGSPAGPVQRVTNFGPVGSTRHAAISPELSYDAANDTFAVVYMTWAVGPPLMQEIELQLVGPDGGPRGAPQAVSPEPAGSRVGIPSKEPDIAYNPADGGRFLVVWRGDALPVDAVQEEDGSEVWGRLVTAATGAPIGDPVQISDMGLPADPSYEALQPRVVSLADSSYLVAWVGDEAVEGEGEAYARPVARDGTVSPGRPQQRLTHAGPDGDGDHDVFFPSLAVGRSGQILLAYHAIHAEAEGSEVYVIGVTASGEPDGLPRQVSSAGPPASGAEFVAANPALSYSRPRDAFMVTWRGTDDGRGGLAAGEFEVAGRLLDGSGSPVGRDVLVSRTGFDGAVHAGPAVEAPGLGANPVSGDWLAVWSADDARPPDADDDFDIWGRRIGANDDRDYDGVSAPVDCDDGDPAVRPGAAEVPGNGVDDDCTGGDRLLPVPARVRGLWLYSDRTIVERLTVEGLRPGMTVALRCTGRGCPRRLAHAPAVRVARSSAPIVLTGLLRKALLRPRSVVEVRVGAVRSLGLVERFRIRRGAPPRQTTRCVAPGSEHLVRCPA